MSSSAFFVNCTYDVIGTRFMLRNSSEGLYSIYYAILKIKLLKNKIEKQYIFFHGFILFRSFMYLHCRGINFAHTYTYVQVITYTSSNLYIIYIYIYKISIQIIPLSLQWQRLDSTSSPMFYLTSQSLGERTPGITRHTYLLHISNKEIHMGGGGYCK